MLPRLSFGEIGLGPGSCVVGMLEDGVGDVDDGLEGR